MLLTQNCKTLLLLVSLACFVFVPAQAQTTTTPANSEAPLDGTISGSAVSESGQALAVFHDPQSPVRTEIFALRILDQVSTSFRVFCLLT
jgi:hypothetical protein